MGNNYGIHPALHSKNYLLSIYATFPLPVYCLTISSSSISCADNVQILATVASLASPRKTN